MQRASRKKRTEIFTILAVAAGLFFAVVAQGALARLLDVSVIPNVVFAYAGLLMAFPFSGVMRFVVAGLFLILHPLTMPFVPYLAVFTAGVAAAWYFMRRHFDEGSLPGVLVSVACFTLAFYLFHAVSFVVRGESASLMRLVPAFSIELALNLAVAAIFFVIFSRGLRAVMSTV